VDEDENVVTFENALVQTSFLVGGFASETIIFCPMYMYIQYYVSSTSDSDSESLLPLVVVEHRCDSLAVALESAP